MTLFEEEFKKLVEGAAKVHHMTYCLKEGTILTTHLLNMKCVDCEEFVLNKGVCDPI